AASVGAQSQQDPGNRAFIDVNVGAQPQRHTLNTSSTFSLYDEVATVTSNQPIPNGAIFEVNGGYRIRPHLAVAVGFSSFRRSSAGALSASIPDPLFFNQPRIVSGQTSGLDHVERAVHVQALWIVPVTDRIDVAFSAGPSIIHLALAIACTRQPSTPASPTAAVPSQLDASADGSTLKATAPAPISPINDQQVSDAPTLTASASTLRFAQGTVPFQYRFELFND